MNLTETIATIIAFPITVAIFLSPIIIPIVLYLHFKNKKAKNNFSNTITPYQQSIPIQQQAITQNYISPYNINNFLLTSHEAAFYKDLKPIADKHNLIIFCKMRMADILSVKPTIKGKDFYRSFQRISQKHIDFVLCSQSFIPAVLIEIDDCTHDKANRKESDNLKNAILITLI